jgi:hypothetical protein
MMAWILVSLLASLAGDAVALSPEADAAPTPVFEVHGPDFIPPKP